ncbi:MAG: DUF2461 domain-containing protein [Bacteroidetes bacterium]|nr:DUF2461 domain-containing protein [Bacteroidota bacterium]
MKLISSFLEELKNNNNREWFQQNKFRYDEAKAEFEAFTNILIVDISKFDNEIKNISSKDCLFRIYNDIRFAKNKPPYKSNFGAHISKNGKNSGNSGYYLHIEPDNCFLAGGIYMPMPDKLKLIRQEIYYNIEEFNSILSENKFKKYFNEIDGEKLKRVPKDFPADFAGSELLKYKSYTALYSIPNKKIFSADLKDTILEIFETMAPLNHFINRALYSSIE